MSGHGIEIGVKRDVHVPVETTIGLRFEKVIRM